MVQTIQDKGVVAKQALNAAAMSSSYNQDQLTSTVALNTALTASNTALIAAHTAANTASSLQIKTLNASIDNEKNSYLTLQKCYSSMKPSTMTPAALQTIMTSCSALKESFGNMDSNDTVIVRSNNTLYYALVCIIIFIIFLILLYYSHW